MGFPNLTYIEIMVTRTGYRQAIRASTVSNILLPHDENSAYAFEELDLPEYESYDLLRQQLLTAITVGNSYFGFA
jgi:hypothetical protein